ncbi:MAG TPA: hypothetical protein VH331_14515 [Allosphingosinicella sp.]|jgi:hypothetical protein|nr:hypothetical protein [Allosphingosinicella sp.]
MKSFDLWLVGFGLRCGALLVGEIACFAFVVPTLFNLHSDLADTGAALLAIVALAGGYLLTASLGREFNLIFRSGDHE